VLISSRVATADSLVSSKPLDIPPVYRPRGDHSSLLTGWSEPAHAESHNIYAQAAAAAALDISVQDAASVQNIVAPAIEAQELDPLYLFACHMEWELFEEPTAGWELLRAARSSNSDTRAQALALLSNSRHLSPLLSPPPRERRPSKEVSEETTESLMNCPYDLQIVDNCIECSHAKPGFFCGFSPDALQALNLVSHKTVVPAGAILFVEGQEPRGVFVVCSGNVNLSTTSREGKGLILRTAEAGETLGLSAAISNVAYEVTAETATPCQISFIERKHVLELLQSFNEIVLQVARCLSHEFQSAYRDIHDLVLTKSSAGKLARLLLSRADPTDDDSEARLSSSMTHEEMAQRIGASRETVTRLITNLKKKRLIRTDGTVLVIRDRAALEALAI